MCESCLGCTATVTSEKMRPLTDEETLTFFKKLSKYIGKNIQYLLKRPDDEKWCFRLHKDRVYYISEKMMLMASNFERKKVLSMGTKFGKFTHSGKFHLHVTCLDYIAQFSLYKVWLKPSAEMTFLYGNHVYKAGLQKMTENTPQYAGVVIFNQHDTPLGFGISAQTTAYTQESEETAIAVLHQADLGEYLRDESHA